MSLADTAWPNVPEDCIVLLPLGSTEQHGPHLPLDTDTVIALEVARRVADGLDELACIAPALSYGSSGEHQGFPGTISIGTEVLAAVIVEWARSVTTWARATVIINGHGGNAGALAMAADLLHLEDREVLVFDCGLPDMDAHAGNAETSMMLAIDPTRVDMSQAAKGNTEHLARLLPEIRAGGMAEVTSTGVLGDPTGATAVEGERLMRAIAERIGRSIRSR